MKACQCCGCVDTMDQLTCALCGEASWVELSEPEPAESMEVSGEPEPVKPRRGRK